jgi:branched-chain amino acid transport system permease protein
MGSILTGLGLGLIEGLAKAGVLGTIFGWPFEKIGAEQVASFLGRLFGPEGSATVVFVIMAIVLLIRPAGLFGKEK